ncbi:MAG: hypothetical protein WD889_00280, partial [Candidatus Colwellbacteria bacterium]
STTTNGILVEGNVGIGTTSPWRTFSVVGTAAIDGLSAAASGNLTVCINNTTKELCIEDLCINRDDLFQIVNAASVTPSTPPSPPSAPEEDSLPAASTEIVVDEPPGETTEEVIVEPAAEAEPPPADEAGQAEPEQEPTPEPPTETP